MSTAEPWRRYWFTVVMIKGTVMAVAITPMTSTIKSSTKVVPFSVGDTGFCRSGGPSSKTEQDNCVDSNTICLARILQGCCPLEILASNVRTSRNYSQGTNQTWLLW